MGRMTGKSAARVPLLNRELGILAFNRRVLAQAQDEAVPLLERLRFLTIVSSNLDEFFEIRVAGIKEQIKLGISEPGPDGLTPKETLAIVTREARALVTAQFDLLNDVLLPELAKAGIRFLRRGTWNDAQRAWVHDYFKREVLPVLTPIGLDPAHPFPRVFNKSLNLIVELEGRDAFGRGSVIAIVQAPRSLPRIIPLPHAPAGQHQFVFLSSVIHAHVGALFPGMEVKGCYQFRVTRNSDLFVDEEEIKNLRIALQGELMQRHFGDAVRLEVVEEISPAMIDFLLQQFQLDEQDLYHVDGPVNLYRLREVLSVIDRPDLKYPAFTPSVPAALEVGDDDLFETIARQDILLHHPYQSFTPVLDFIRSSATDPRVVAIKQTVYRTGATSELMQILIDAARAGKEVTVVVELLARFDEEANLNWAAQLEAVGAHVVYGVVGHKTHAKMALIVRREPGPDGAVLRRYAHLGTGNYHAATARQYTDFGLLTANEEICSDVNEVFKQLTGLGRASRLKHVWQSPFTLHKRVTEAIRNEARIAAEGRPARIVTKMNALLEPRIIEELYAASQAGVKIDLVVRGICALRPGVEGLSGNIRVRSIVGRFLEHSRIFWFRNDGADDVWLSSADWMDRNFFRRIELAFPVLDARLKRRVIKEGLKPYLEDNCQSWAMDGEGGYERQTPKKGARFSAQDELLSLLSVVS